MSCVNVKVEPRLTFTCIRGLAYSASISFTLVHFTCIRTENYAAVEIHPKLTRTTEYKCPYFLPKQT